MTAEVLDLLKMALLTRLRDAWDLWAGNASHCNCQGLQRAEAACFSLYWVFLTMKYREKEKLRRQAACFLEQYRRRVFWDQSACFPTPSITSGRAPPRSTCLLQTEPTNLLSERPPRIRPLNEQRAWQSQKFPLRESYPNERQWVRKAVNGRARSF